MSAHMKKRHISRYMEVIADHELYEIPCASAIQHRLLAILKPYRVYGWQDVISDGAIPVDEVSAFKRLNKKYGKIFENLGKYGRKYGKI